MTCDGGSCYCGSGSCNDSCGGRRRQLSIWQCVGCKGGGCYSSRGSSAVGGSSTGGGVAVEAQKLCSSASRGSYVPAVKKNNPLLMYSTIRFGTASKAAPQFNNEANTKCVKIFTRFKNYNF
jgi:hypothetical protein